jgi:hypothetical protein
VALKAAVHFVDVSLWGAQAVLLSGCSHQVSVALCVRRKPVPEFTKALDEITPGDITKLVTAMLKAPPSFAGSGNISAMPRYDALLRRFS